MSLLLPSSILVLFSLVSLFVLHFRGVVLHRGGDVNGTGLRRLDYNPTIEQRNDAPTRGVLLCTGSKMVPDAHYMLDQLSDVWQSSLSVTIVHCNEISAEAQASFAARNASMLNICDGSHPYLAPAKRLRGWFCKTAALLLSPYNQSMVVDLDVVWFNNPDILFDAPGFKSTGALFFRDRVTHAAKKKNVNDRVFQDVLEEFIESESQRSGTGINITAELANIKASQNGQNFFWRNVANRSSDTLAPALDNFQDSSVILLDSASHPETLAVLKRLMPDFNIGYGDKEIYWLAATIADEAFAFEPFLAGLYGGCGLLMHYNPLDAAGDPRDALPLYINGEWLLEKIHVLGQDLEERMPNATLVDENTELFDYRNDREKQCACQYLGCRPVPKHVQLLLLRAQWERLSRWCKRQWGTGDCMSIYKPEAAIVSEVVLDFMQKGLCSRYGCTDYPIFVNSSYDYYMEYFCDPLYFEDAPPADLRDAEKKAQTPPPLPVLTEAELVRGNSRTVYLFVNGSLRVVPNIQTFMSLGRDFSEVVVLPDWALPLLPHGPDLPSA